MLSCVFFDNYNKEVIMDETINDSADIGLGENRERNIRLMRSRALGVLDGRIDEYDTLSIGLEDVAFMYNNIQNVFNGNVSTYCDIITILQGRIHGTEDIYEDVISILRACVAIVAESKKLNGDKINPAYVNALKSSIDTQYDYYDEEPDLFSITVTSKIKDTISALGEIRQYNILDTMPTVIQSTSLSVGILILDSIYRLYTDKAE